MKELIKAFQEAVDDYVETCQRLGKEPNKTYKGSFNVRIPADMHREAAIYAASKDISLNDFVKTAIQAALMSKSLLQNYPTPTYSLQVAGEAAPYRTADHKTAARKSKKASSAEKRASTRKRGK